MLILKTAAFCLPLIGLGGIAGAVETGTSPVNAIIVFCAGCLVMLLYVKLDNKEMRKMADQTVREQAENKTQIITEIDKTIVAVCEKVRNDEIIGLEYSQMVNALANLVTARALADYASKSCVDSLPTRDS